MEQGKKYLKYCDIFCPSFHTLYNWFTCESLCVIRRHATFYLRCEQKTLVFILEILFIFDFVGLLFLKKECLPQIQNWLSFSIWFDLFWQEDLVKFSVQHEKVYVQHEKETYTGLKLNECE